MRKPEKNACVDSPLNGLPFSMPRSLTEHLKRLEPNFRRGMELSLALNSNWEVNVGRLSVRRIGDRPFRLYRTVNTAIIQSFGEGIERIGRDVKKKKWIDLVYRQ